MNIEKQNWSFETKAILSGQSPDPATGSTIVPIYQTSTYTQAALGENKGYIYSRTGNPTRTACATCLADLEDGTNAYLYPSGMAAIHSIMLTVLRPGAHVVTVNDLYGGAQRMFGQVLPEFNYSFSFASNHSTEEIISKITSETKMLWLESPSNPCMFLCDIEEICSKVAEINKSENRDILVVVDNTFASPYLQKPLNLGADIVMHSGTKYLGGHSDVLIGAVVVKETSLAEKFTWQQNATGNLAGPFDCWMLMKGMKTLAVRMKEHHKNAIEVAKWFENNKKVSRVYCPALESNDQYELYKKQMSMYNGMISIEVDASYEDVKKLVSSLKIFQLAESLGGVESLVCQPASMTHAAVAPERRLELGIKDSFVRFSVGIENIKDIMHDLEQAFAQIR
jgi:cystathionine beta-lyase/cystathionine gamma-synthase